MTKVIVSVHSVIVCWFNNHCATDIVLVPFSAVVMPWGDIWWCDTWEFNMLSQADRSQLGLTVYIRTKKLNDSKIHEISPIGKEKSMVDSGIWRKCGCVVQTCRLRLSSGESRWKSSLSASSIYSLSSGCQLPYCIVATVCSFAM